MVRLSVLFLASAAMLAPAFASGEGLASVSGHYAIQPSSHVAFSVDQVGSGGIAGTFGQFSGNFDLNSQNIAKSSVSFTLKPGSVSTQQQRITDFLQSSAVFDVKNYPTITFHSTRVSQTGPTTATIEGDLSAHGKTHKETFTASLDGHDGSLITFHVAGGVLRSLYGMDVGTPIYSNVVKFDMNLQGKK